ncbi:MAG: hypothetical protein ABFD90_18850 [Phycisphaerales bacterium]
MRRMIVVLAVFAVLPVAAWADMSFTFGGAPALDTPSSGFTTSVGGAVVDTFAAGSTPAGWTYGGSFSIEKGSDGFKAAPASAAETLPTSSEYFCVPAYIPAGQPASGMAWVTFSTDQNYLGLYWGSIDTYNTVRFYLDDVLVDTVTGGEVLDAFDGVSGARDNSKYVNLSGEWFDKVEFESTQRAFELDNLAVSVVPVPGAVLLGFLGLGAAGLKLRRHV